MAVKNLIPSRALTISFALLALEGLGCLVALLQIPVDPAGAVLFGLSGARLAMATILALGAVSMAAAAFLQWSNKQWQRVFGKVLTAGWVFWPLLAGALAGFAFCTTWPFANATLQATFTRAFPLALFATLVCAQLLALRLWYASADRERKIALIGGTLVLVFTYIAATGHYAQVNREYWLSDQEAMLNFVRGLEASGFRDLGTRDFLPGFPALASPFVDGSLIEREMYAQGKTFNIGLSLVMLAAIYLISRRYFDWLLAGLLTAIAGLTLFIYKAPYFQPELLYYFLSFVAFVLMLELLRRPNWLVAIGAGLLLAAANYVKASVLPAVLLFTAAMLAQAAFAGWVERQGLRIVGRFVGMLAVAWLAFLLPLAPYLAESKATYGSYFYNVNSTYFIWFDSWGEAKASEQVFHYTAGVPDVSKDQLPSLQNYLRTHDLGEIVQRFADGFVNQGANWLNTFALISFPLLFLLALGVLAYQRWPRVRELVQGHPVLTAFILLYFVGYTTLFAWYGPIADYSDRRFTYGLYLPLLFCAFFGLKQLSQPSARKQSDAAWVPAFYASAALLLAADLLLHLPYQFLEFHWFGK
jgi:hypothetical protein